VNSGGVPKTKFAGIFGSDERITIVSVEKGFEQMLALADGESIVCCTPGNGFSPALLDNFNVAYKKTPDPALNFYDQVENTNLPAQLRAFFKPAQHSPKLLLSVII